MKQAEMTQDQLIEHLRNEIKRVKLQRNEIEQDLIKSNRKVFDLTYKNSQLLNKSKQIAIGYLQNICTDKSFNEYLNTLK